MRKLFRIALLVALAVWAWRYAVGLRRPGERVTVAFADGSAIVLEPGSAGFERVAAEARAALAR